MVNNLFLEEAMPLLINVALTFSLFTTPPFLMAPTHHEPKVFMEREVQLRVAAANYYAR